MQQLLKRNFSNVSVSNLYIFFLPASQDNAPDRPPFIGPSEDPMQVFVSICCICFSETDFYFNKGCAHPFCKTCLERNTHCPNCRHDWRLTGEGEEINKQTTSGMAFARRGDVASGFGLTPEVISAAASQDGQRIADVTPQQELRRRNEEAIRSAIAASKFHLYLLIINGSPY